jgi:tetratricopeptide (TPR) repeat protein
MADVERVEKDFGPAQEHLERARSLEPDSPVVKDGLARYHKDLGFAFLLKGRKEAAFVQFEKALATEAKNVDLAQVKAILSRGEDAASDPEIPVDPKVAEIMKEKSERARLLFVKARKLKGERDFDGAVKAILESLTALETAEGRFVLGQIFRDQGKNEEAERAYRRVLENAEA